MSDTSLTPQQKQHKMLELNKLASSTTSQKATTSSSARENSNPNPASASEDAEQKRMAIQDIVKDTSLTALERQTKIQEVMNSSYTTTMNGGTSARNAGGDSVTPIQAIISRESLDVRAKQEKLKEYITSSSSKQTNSAANGDVEVQLAIGPSKSSTVQRQQVVSKLMTDSTLTPQEKQEQIKEISKRFTPAPSITKSKQESAKQELLRKSFGASATALETLKEEAATKKAEKEAECASLRRSYGSPTAAVAEAMKSAQKEVPLDPEEETEADKRPSKFEKDSDYLDPSGSMELRRTSFGSPTSAAVQAMLLSATEKEESFSHIRKIGDLSDSKKPDPKGSRKSEIERASSKPPSKDPSVEPKKVLTEASATTTKAVAAAAAPKPAATNNKAEKPGTGPATKPVVAKTTNTTEKDALLPDIKPKTQPQAGPRSSMMNSKLRLTKDEDGEGDKVKPESSPVPTIERPAPVTADKAKPANVNPKSIDAHVGASAPKGILKTEEEPTPQNACCVIS